MLTLLCKPTATSYATSGAQRRALRVKGHGSFLQTGLEAIQNAYGDDVVREQLELAINGKWQSITLANYERFKPQQKPWEKEPETKHPAYRDAREIIAEQEAKWKDIPSMTGGRGVLDPDAF